MRTLPRRSGITLLQVMIVLFILAIAFWLGMAFVVRVRAAAAMVQCANNCKQIVIAAHNYASANQDTFPAGTITDSAERVEDRLSWLFEVLPYIEANNLYSRMDKKQGWNSDANRAVASISYKPYRCSAAPSSESDQMHFTAYVGVAGVGEDAAILDAKHRRSGLFGYSRRIKPADIRDGLANTMMMIETWRDNGPWAAGGPATVRGIDSEAEPPIAVDGPFGVIHAELAVGRKAAANVALADGSVRKLSQTTSAEVLAALATIAGGDNDRLLVDW